MKKSIQIDYLLAKGRSKHPIRRKGWQATLRPNKTTLKAMADARAGRTFKAAFVDDLIAQVEA